MTLIGTRHHRLNMGSEKSQTGLAIAQFIFHIQVVAASGTHERTRSLWMIDIESVTAYPALVYLDVTVTVIKHIP